MELVSLVGSGYEGVSRSFRTESERNTRLPLVLLVEK